MTVCIPSAALAVTMGAYFMCSVVEPGEPLDWQLARRDLFTDGEGWIAGTQRTPDHLLEIPCMAPWHEFRVRAAYADAPGLWSPWSRWIPCVPDLDGNNDGIIGAAEFVLLRTLFGTRLEPAGSGKAYLASP